MDEISLCRICVNFASSTSSTNLFDRKAEIRCLIGQIKEITGCSLRNAKSLPKLICGNCEESLKQANQFQKRCRDSQLYFQSAKYKEFIQTKLKDEIVLEVQVNYHNNACDDDDKKSNEIILEPDSELLSKALNKVVESIEHEVKLEDDTQADLREFISFDHIEISSNKEDDVENTKKRQPIKRILNKYNSNGKKLKSNRKEKADNGKIDYMCDQCGNHFSTLHHFKTHLRRHANDKRYQCEICPDKFYTHSELKRHMRRHTGERPFACKHCERRFTDYSTRVKHERTHTNDRPFQCGQCEKAFTTSYILKNHMLVHTGERCFMCQVCDKAFQRQDNLAAHYRSISHKQLEEKLMRR